MCDAKTTLLNRRTVLMGEMRIVREAIEIMTPLLTDGNVSFMEYRKLMAPMQAQYASLLKCLDQNAVALAKL